jgi:hypothetical protein
MDILARAVACNKIKEIHNLDYYKELAKQSEARRQWAERTEALLVSERETSASLRAWAERTEALLVSERETSASLRARAERTEALLVSERETSASLRAKVNKFEKILFYPLLVDMYKKAKDKYHAFSGL